MKKFFTKVCTFSVTLMLMVSIIIPAKTEAATVAELQMMIARLTEQISSLKGGSGQVQVPDIYVPRSSASSPVTAFADFKQVEKQISVDGSDTLLEGKIRPVKYNRNLNNVTFYVAPGTSNINKRPWSVFKDLRINVNGYTVRTVNVEDESLWRPVSVRGKDIIYAVTIYQGNISIPALSAHKFSVDIDSYAGEDGEQWKIWIPKNGITTWSKVTNHVSYGPSSTYVYTLINDKIEEESQIDVYDNDVRQVTIDESNPDQKVIKYRLGFEIGAIDSDIYISKNAVQSSAEKGVSFRVDGPSVGDISSVLVSNAEEVGSAYLVEEGEVEEFTLFVTQKPTVSGKYRLAIDSVNFSKVPNPSKDDVIVFIPEDAGLMTEYLFVDGVTNPTSTASIDTFTANPSSVDFTKNGQQTVTLSWQSKGTSYCTLFNNPSSEKIGPVLVATNLKPSGTYKINPYWNQNELSIAKQYSIVCQDASTLKDKVVASLVNITLASTSLLKYDIDLQKPTEGQIFKVGDDITLEWKTTNLNNQVANLTLFGNNTERHVITGIPLGSGKTSYKIPASDSLGKITDGEYKLSLWVTGTKDGDPKNVNDYVMIKISNASVPSPETIVYPNKNNFACDRTVDTKLGSNALACYGMWDYGNSFGGDVAMCGSYGQTNIGCKIKAPMCVSGYAKATAYISGDMALDQAGGIAQLLGTTPLAVTKGVVGVWEYKCTEVTNSTGPRKVPFVKGASTDIYTQMAATITAISRLVDELYR